MRQTGSGFSCGTVRDSVLGQARRGMIFAPILIPCISSLGPCFSAFDEAGGWRYSRYVRVRQTKNKKRHSKSPVASSVRYPCVRFLGSMSLVAVTGPFGRVGTGGEFIARFPYWGGSCRFYVFPFPTCVHYSSLVSSRLSTAKQEAWNSNKVSVES